MQEPTPATFTWNATPIASLGSCPRQSKEIRLTVSGGSDVKIIKQLVIVMIDVLSPGRLLRSIKTVLRSKEYSGFELIRPRLHRRSVNRHFVTAHGTHRRSANRTLGNASRHLPTGQIFRRPGDQRSSQKRPLPLPPNESALSTFFPARTHCGGLRLSS